VFGNCPADAAWRLRRATLAIFAIAAAGIAAAAPAEARTHDLDHDGLTNRFEVTRSHTSPRRADTDRDSLSDKFELRRSHTNPLKRDTDADSLTDGYELKKSQTSPRRKDTDADGSSDSLELRLGTDPRKKPHPRTDPPPPPGVDTTPPETTITGAPSGTVATRTASFSFSSSEVLSTFQCQLDSGAWTSCISPRIYPDLADGPHTFRVRASDALGNQDASPATRTWTVNTTPAPVAAFTVTTQNPVVGQPTSFDAGASSCAANPCAYRWLHGSTQFATGTTASFTYSQTGTKTVTLEVADTQNRAATDTEQFQVGSAPAGPDTTPPDTSITAGPSGTVSGGSASFSFSATETGSTYECQLDSPTWTSCSSPRTYSALADGAHTFSVRATDAAGNVDATPATRTWTVDTTTPPDTTPPDTSITGGPSGTATSGDASFSFSATESGSTFECQLDSPSWTSCSSPRSYSGLANGAHTFSVRATDAADNIDATPATRTWTVAVPPPGGSCDSTVSTAAQITTAAASSANEGKVVCVAAGQYGRLSFGSVSHPASNKVILRSAVKNQAVLTSVVFGNAAGIRFEDFRVQGGFEHPADGTTMQYIDFVRNDVGGTRNGGFMLNCKVYNVLIESNYIHDIEDTPDWWAGYGIRLSGDPSSSGCDWRRNIRIRYNTFERTQNDSMDIGATDGGEIVANVVTDVNKGPLDPGEHTDALMFWAGSKNFLIKDNRFIGNNDQWLISGGASGVQAINNLIVRGGQWAIQAGEAGSSSAGIHNSVFRNNTIWDTGRGWNDQCSPTALPDTNCMGIDIKGQSTVTNTFDRNVSDMVSGCRYVNAGERNALARGSKCRTSDVMVVPQFADTVNYQPTNLPPGFEDVGYKPVPAGHTATPQP
jgi:hypothetical protein